MSSIFKKIFAFLTILIFLFCITASIFGILLFHQAKEASIVIKENAKPIQIYDRENTLVSTDGFYYEYCPLSEISEDIVHAFVSVEDRDFYRHIGISFRRILSSAWKNLTSLQLSSGASTITQQYVKNAYLTNEKTFTRKLNEMALAIELEKKYTKDQIMEAYLNTILFGGNIYGIAMASKYYFNKTPKEVSLSQAAVLAGMIQMPNYYHPFQHPGETNERKNVVLKCMYEEEYIDTLDYEQAQKETVEQITEKGFINRQVNYLTPYLDYVFEHLPQQEGSIEEVHTYLDVDIQKQLYSILNNDYQLFNDDLLNCAIVVLDNRTYGIKALAGNRSFDHRVLDYAATIPLQPGSTIKPILDYAPAFEYLGYHPATLIVDEPYTYQDGTPIKNYDNQFLGTIPLRKALNDSRNIPAVKLFNEVGYQRAFEFAKKIGIEKQDTIYEADAIGGSSYGYTLLSLANAYQAFANLGYFKKVSAVSAIRYDISSYQNDENPQLVMQPSTAFLINTVLHDVFRGSSYDQTKTYMMAKTGQTNFDANTRQKYQIPSSATKDSLVIAYTKDLTIGIWVGYETIQKGQFLDYYKKNIPRTIMKLLMDEFAEENQYYPLIDDVSSCYITIYNNQVYLAKENGYLEYFQKGNEPLSYPDYQTPA